MPSAPSSQTDQHRTTPRRISFEDVVLIGRIVPMTTDRPRHGMTDTGPHRRTGPRCAESIALVWSGPTSDVVVTRALVGAGKCGCQPAAVTRSL
jgi:hypothetical protein